MKRLLLALVLTASVATAGDTGINVPYTRFTLPNGLTVILHEDHTTPTVAVNVYYHVGSGREKPGRTGFAHLFEHIMYEGSGHVPEGKYDQWLEMAGGDNNGSTNSDRTNYWINIPSNALELALFVESDRMGYLLDAMSPAKVDGQRDVVKNERRQSYENRPYGMSSILVDENLYPDDHPYHWPTIGSMEDLSAASFDDVVQFFKRFYGPNNASLSVGGDIDPVKTRALIEKWFSDIPAGPPVPPPGAPVAFLGAEKRLVLEDKVQLPRLYMAWHSPAIFTPGDAELDIVANVLAGGKNSRLYKRLVYELQIAQDVSAYQGSAHLGSSFQIVSTARAGHTLAEVEKVITEELHRLLEEGVAQRELDRAVNQYEAGFLRRLESVGGFGGKVDQLNNYLTETGNPDYFNEDLARYRALSPGDVRSAAQTYLRGDNRVVLSVIPVGKPELASPARKEAK
ncbi:MAG: insulinase family protein [Ignavibacteriae bacterium]|nr:insulinase family protein [Ignavibacteriota bacterium]